MHSHHPLHPYSTRPALIRVLQVGGVTILLDCGWDIHFDPALLEPLREVVKRVDLVLISHSDLEHLGVRPNAQGVRACACVMWFSWDVGDTFGLGKGSWGWLF